MSNNITVVNKLKTMLNVPSVMEQFKNSLGENSGAFTASLVEMLSSNNDLKQCQPKDLIMEALKAASLKLPINKNLGHAWIIPRREKGQMRPNFQIGYRGYIQLAIRTGKYKCINANTVPANWNVEEDYLTGEIHITGAPEVSTEEPQGYFAYFELVNGFRKTLYYSKDYMIKHMNKYAKGVSSKFSPWNTDFDKMAIKTVTTHLLSKYGFLSTEMATAFSNDIEQDSQSPSDIADNQENSVDFDKREIYVEPEQIAEKPTPQAETNDVPTGAFD